MANTTINIPDGNMIENSKRAEVLQKVAHLAIDDLDRIGELAGNPKALKALKSKWALLKAMFK